VAAAALGAALPVAASPAVADAPSRPLGVVSQTDPSAAEFEAMRLGGVRAYRWLISWPALQPQAGVPPDWAATDRIVATLARNRIAALPFVSGSPCFAVDCDGAPASRAHRQPPVDSAEARLAWGRFVGQLVERYGPDGSFWSANPSLPNTPIRQWQIWNEQNALRNFVPVPSVERYAELLAIAARAIRARDPGARVVLGGMSGNPGGRGAIKAPDYLAALYRVPGAAEHFDAVAVHPYAAEVAGVVRQVRETRAVIEAAGDARTPIRVTELGWGIESDGEERLATTVDGQAAMLTDSFDLLLARAEQWNLAGILWYAWRDTPSGVTVCRWCGTAGLFDAEGNPRPAWSAYADLAGGEAVDLPSEEDGPPVALLALAGAIGLAAAASWLLLRRTPRR
jgi:hypothetical protein